MKQYDSYKDSGVEWIGEVPSHWEILRGKYMLDILSGFPFDSKKFEYDDNYMPLIRIRDINSSSTEVYYSGVYPKESVVKKGEVLIGMDGDFNVSRWNGPEALLNQRVCKLSESSKMNTCFAFYMLSLPLKLINDVTYATTVKHLSVYDIYNTFLPVPTIAEQEGIANYLEQKCGEIDKVISTQQKRIEYLQELKQSVITHAVTKGLSEDVEMKESGVSWIGSTPSHWKRCRFKDFIKQETSASTSERKIGLENIESKTGRYIETSTEYEGNGVQFEEGYILYGKLRPYLQKVWIAEFSGNAVGDFFVYSMKDNADSQFVQYLMLSDGFTKETDGSTFGAKMPRVASDFILTMRYYLPPKEEQLAIVSYLNEKCSIYDPLIAKAQKEIDILEEYKQSVITEAVTGKIKVC